MSTAAVTIVAGVGCQLFARRLSTPPILPLLLVGMVLGPGVLNLVCPISLGPALRVIVGFAVAIILFEGGLSLGPGTLRNAGKSIRRLCTVGAATTWTLCALLAYALYRVPHPEANTPALGWDYAALFGALVIVTGPTVIQPLLKAVKPRERIADVLRGEAVIVDPIGALAAVLALELLVSLHEGASAGGALIALGKRLALGGCIGLTGGWLIARALRMRSIVPADLRNLVVLIGAIGLYALSEALAHESGVLTVTLAGLLLGALHPPGIEEIEEFKVQLTALMVSLVFILLAADVTFQQMYALGWRGAALVAVVIFVVRPISVHLSLWGTELSMRERWFISWISPRGIVAAAVSALFALLLQEDLGAVAGSKGVLIRDLTFAVILGTVVVQAPTASLVARLLGVVAEHPRGVLFLGANRVARALAQPLWDNGVKVLLVDTNRDKVNRARNVGLPARVANLLDDYAADQLNLGGLGKLLAVTTSDSANRLAVRLYSGTFGEGRTRAIALDDSPPEAEVAETLDGRGYLFGGLTWEEIDQRMRRGSAVCAVTFTETTTPESLAQLVGEDVVPLLTLTDGRAAVVDKRGSFDARTTLIYLA